jgi:hypothetical protein
VQREAKLRSAQSAVHVATVAVHAAAADAAIEQRHDKY